MKRRYVLFVPVAAVTLWLNGVSDTTAVNAAGLQTASQQPALVYQNPEYNQKKQPVVAPKKEKKTKVAAAVKTDKKEKTQLQAAAAKDKKAPQVHKATKKPVTVDAATKEKRKQALAADYKQRKESGEYDKPGVNQPVNQKNGSK